MVRSTLIYVSLSLMFVACKHSQEFGSLTSKKTERHVNVVGTHVFLIPPEGFTQETGYVGFHRTDGNGFIQVREVKMHFDSMSSYYAKERQGGDGGYTLKAYDEITLNHYQARYFAIQREAWTVHTLVFGDSTLFVSLMSGFPPDKQLEEEIRATFRSVYYDTAFVVDPLAIAPFVIDHSATKFKLANFSSGGYVYTSDGNPYPKDRVGINVKATPNRGMTAEDHLLTHAREMGRVQNKSDLKNTSSMTVNGHPAYQGELHFSYNGKNFVVLLAAIADKEKVILVEGFIESDYEKNLAELRTFVNAISLR